MRAEQFRKALRHLDLSHAEFCDYFGVSPRTATNYATYGIRDVARATLLTLLLSGKINLADIETRKPRLGVPQWKRRAEIDRRIGATPVAFIRPRPGSR